MSKEKITPKSIFDSLWTEDIHKIIRENTNANMVQYYRYRQEAFTWKEYYEAFTVILYMMVDKKPTLSQYWDRDNKKCSIAVKDLIPKNMFLQFYQSLSCFPAQAEQPEQLRDQREQSNTTDDSNSSDTSLNDASAQDNQKIIPRPAQQNGYRVQYVSRTKTIAEKIQQFADLLSVNFRNARPFPKVMCIDESLLNFYGRYKDRVHMPLKPGKDGILFRMLSDSDDGYCFNLLLYNSDATKYQKTVIGIFQKLLQGIDLAHTFIVCDNFYTTKQLFKHYRNTHLCIAGTFRAN